MRILSGCLFSARSKYPATRYTDHRHSRHVSRSTEGQKWVPTSRHGTSLLLGKKVSLPLFPLSVRLSLTTQRKIVNVTDKSRIFIEIPLAEFAITFYRRFRFRQGRKSTKLLRSIKSICIESLNLASGSLYVEKSLLRSIRCS